MDFLHYKKIFEAALSKQDLDKSPEQLYAPINYILSLGGKRVRPLLTLMVCDYFEENPKNALPAAIAVELFHNFSLIHDDIMDQAPLRRGQPTVHKKWNVNTGILSGDAMLILAYQYFESYEATLFKKLSMLFSKTALEVCEGQQFDMLFETQPVVTLEAYIKMITYKTAVLIGAAMQMGAIVAKASSTCEKAIFEFGKNLGIAFQIQDDYLDTYGDKENFGKQVGGDILANKKTFLYHVALQNLAEESKKQLHNLFNSNTKHPIDKVEQVTALFTKSGAQEACKNSIANYTELAFSHLENLKITEQNKLKLKDFGNWLMTRNT